MTEASSPLIAQVADALLGGWGLAGAVNGQAVAELIAGGVARFLAGLHDADSRRLLLRTD